MLHGGSLVAGDAGVVAVVVRRQVGDAQRAGEVDVVHSHAQADGDRPSVFLPGDVQRPVARHDHAGDEDALADGETLELKGLNVGGDCGAEVGREIWLLLQVPCPFSHSNQNNLATAVSL